jgi:hypothetical protein
MAQVSLADILELPVPERIRLVEEIWDSIAEIPEAVPLTDPDTGSPWADVKARILAR